MKKFFLKNEENWQSLKINKEDLLHNSRVIKNYRNRINNESRDSRKTSWNKKDSKWYITKVYDILGNIDPGIPYQDIFL